MVNFIGIGAQKSGTSWVYACLYEHPQICAPIKEIHFFSRPRYENGKEWYEAHFKNCDEKKLKGEFSTSYLYSKEAPERIHACYPQAKIIAILRNPIDRAYSQYRNSIKSGEISKGTSFEEYMKNEDSVLQQGLYVEQLERYYALFPKEQILVLIYEDKKDPVFFMKRIYQFLGINETFVSSMVHHEINIARTPKFVVIERTMHHIAEWLRKNGFDRIVYYIRKAHISDMIRMMNTKDGKNGSTAFTYDRAMLASYFREDVTHLRTLIGRNMNAEWNI